MSDPELVIIDLISGIREKGNKPRLSESIRLVFRQASKYLEAIPQMTNYEVIPQTCTTSVIITFHLVSFISAVYGTITSVLPIYTFSIVTRELLCTTTFTLRMMIT
jgi:hypothetical protein